MTETAKDGLAGIFLGACSALTPQPTPSKQKHIVLVVLDGFRPDYREFASTPNLDSLMKKGATYQNSWVGQLMNVTPPGHVSISTGLSPNKTDVCSFAWKNKEGVLEQYYSFPNTLSGLTNNLLQAKGIKGIASQFKSVYPRSITATVTSVNFYALAGLSADGVDVEIGCDMSNVSGVQSSAPEMKPVAFAGTDVDVSILNDPELTRKRLSPEDEDTWAMDVAIKVLNQYRPGVLMMNLPFIDTPGHLYGNIVAKDKMKIAVENADKQIGRLMDAYKTLNLYEDTIFLIASDHGQNPSLNWIDKEKISAILTNAGAKEQLLIHPDLFLVDPSKSEVVAEDIAKEELPGILGTFYRTNADGGGFTYRPSTTTRQKLSGALLASYQYLTDTYRTTGPDVLILLEEDWRINYILPGMKESLAGGHDTVTWTNQHNLLLIAGPGVKNGIVTDSPARLIDIAPTVLTLAGVQPAGMEGIVLADCLTSPTANQVSAQNDLSEKLKPLQEALKAQSQANLSGGQ